MLENLNPGDPLPGNAKLARICSFNKQQTITKLLLPSAFKYRPDETYLSVDAIDIYEGTTIEQLSQLRKACKDNEDRYTIGGQAKIVVAKAKDWVKYLRVKTMYRPPAEVDYPEHAGLRFVSSNIDEVNDTIYEFVQYINKGNTEFSIIPASEIPKLN